MPPPSYTIGNRIRELRFAKSEMTQAQLAEACGITRQTVIALEKGKYLPSLELAFLIAHALGTPLDRVFDFVTVMDTPA